MRPGRWPHPSRRRSAAPQDEGMERWLTQWKCPPAGSRYVPPISPSRRRIDRFAGSGLVRIDRDELDVVMLVDRKLAERRQLADLAAHVIEREGAVERLELAVEREGRLAQLHLVEAGRNRQRLLDHERGGVARDRVEAELHLAVVIFLLPGGAEILHVHPEIDRIIQLRRRHIGPDVL